MNTIKLSSVREGVSLLGEVVEQIDFFAQGVFPSGGNKRVSAPEVAYFVDAFYMRPTANAAVEAVLAYAKQRYGTTAPSVAQMNRALAAGMGAIAKADANRNGWLSPAEQASLAPTWGAMVAFAKEHKGLDIGRTLDADL